MDMNFFPEVIGASQGSIWVIGAQGWKLPRNKGAWECGFEFFSYIVVHTHLLNSVMSHLRFQLMVRILLYFLALSELFSIHLFIYLIND